MRSTAVRAASRGRDACRNHEGVRSPGRDRLDQPRVCPDGARHSCAGLELQVLRKRSSPGNPLCGWWTARGQVWPATGMRRFRASSRIARGGAEAIAGWSDPALVEARTRRAYRGGDDGSGLRKAAPRFRVYCGVGRPTAPLAGVARVSSAGRGRTGPLEGPRPVGEDHARPVHIRGPTGTAGSRSALPGADRGR
jgi:hypothetical protein